MASSKVDVRRNRCIGVRIANEKVLKIAFSAPLNEQDSETQTYGCRQNNPNIYANNNIPGICASTSYDCICKKPSRSWKKQFYKLKES